MENKLTAVDWLLKEINERNGFIFTIYYEELFNQAKAMEKEQIMKAFDINYDYPDGIAASERYYKRKYASI